MRKETRKMSKIDDLIQDAIEIAEDAPEICHTDTELSEMQKDALINMVKKLAYAVDTIYDLLEKM